MLGDFRHRRRPFERRESEALECRLMLTPQLQILREHNNVGNDEYKLLVDNFHMGTVEQTPAGVTQFRGNPDRFQRDSLTGNENGFGPTELFGVYFAGLEIDATGGRIEDVTINAELFEIEARGTIPSISGFAGTWIGDYTAWFDPLTQSVVFDGSVTVTFSEVVTGDMNIGRLSSNHVQLDMDGSVVQTGDVRFPIVFEYETAGGRVTESWDPIPTNPQETGVRTFPDIHSFETSVHFSGDVNISDPLQVIRKPNQTRTVATVGDAAFIFAGADYAYGDNVFSSDNMGGIHLVKLQSQSQAMTFSTHTIWTPADTSTVSLPVANSVVTEGDSGFGTTQIPVVFTYDEFRMDTIQPYAISYSVTNLQDGTRQQGTLQFSGTDTQQSIPVTWTADTVPGPDKVFQIELLAVDSAFVRPDVWITELLVADDDAAKTQISGLVFEDMNADGFHTTAAAAALGLTIDSRGTYHNAYGQDEHWLRTNTGAWAALLADGRIIQWDRTPKQVSGPVIARVDPRAHSIPALLTHHTPETGTNGVTVELLDESGNVVQSTVSTDIDLNNSSTRVSGAYLFHVVAGNYSVRVAAGAGPVASPGITDIQAKQVYDLDVAYGFKGGKLFENWGGLGEKWIWGNAGWHYVIPTGAVYRWDRQSQPGHLDGTLVETLSAAYYHQIDLLFAAENPLLSTQAGQPRTVDAGIYRPATIVGTHFEDANLNGVQEPGDTPINGTTVSLSLPNGVRIAVAETADIDLNGNGTIEPTTERGRYQFLNVLPGRYFIDIELAEGQIYSQPIGPQPVLAYTTQQSYRLTTTGNLFENWGGRNERWLYGQGSWYFLTPDGQLRKWDGRSGRNGIPLTGEFRIAFDPFYYSNISFLYDAVDPVLLVRSDAVVHKSFSTGRISN